MKKILSILLIGASGASLSAEKMGKKATTTVAPIKNYIEEAKSTVNNATNKFLKNVGGKTFTLSLDLTKRIAQNEAEEHRLGAQAIKELGVLNFKSGTPERKLFDKSARLRKELADTIDALSITKPIKISFKNRKLTQELIDNMMEKVFISLSTMEEISKQPDKTTGKRTTKNSPRPRVKIKADETLQEDDENSTDGEESAQEAQGTHYVSKSSKKQSNQDKPVTIIVEEEEIDQQ